MRIMEMRITPAEAIMRAAVGGMTPHVRPGFPRQYMRGECYAFALALAHLMPGTTFVGIGDRRFSDHVGLRVDAAQEGERFFDVRGVLDTKLFCLGVGSEADLIELSAAEVKVQYGIPADMKAPYRGIDGMAAAIKAAKGWVEGVNAHLMTQT